MPATLCFKTVVMTMATPDPITRRPTSCLTKPPANTRQLRNNAPMQTAREGAMKGATHIEPMTAAALLSRSPAVAIAAATTTMARYPPVIVAPAIARCSSVV